MRMRRMVRFLHCFETMYYKKKVLGYFLHTTHYTLMLLYFKGFNIPSISIQIKLEWNGMKKSQITDQTLGLKLQLSTKHLGVLK